MSDATCRTASSSSTTRTVPLDSVMGPRTIGDAGKMRNRSIGIPGVQLDPLGSLGVAYTSRPMERRLYIETYGCQMNVADSELMQGLLDRAGYTRVGRADEADVILVNTCAIREHAEQRIYGRLGELTRHKLRRPGVVLGVAGCMAQHLRAKLIERVPQLDLVVGPDGYLHLPELIDEAREAPTLAVRLSRVETYGDLVPARADGVRAWVSIMRGCDKFCTFCIVPYVRGRERSLPVGDVLRQVEHAAAEGFREIVFLGQTVNAYRDGDVDFAELLARANRVEGIVRIRFTSPHPSDMSDRAIEALATCEKVPPHVHLPLQSGSNYVLERMRGPYPPEPVGVVREIRAFQDDRVRAPRGACWRFDAGPRRRGDAARAARGGGTGSEFRGYRGRYRLSLLAAALLLVLLVLLGLLAPSHACATAVPGLRYRIDVTLDPLRHRLSGRAAITYRSGADSLLPSIYLHAYP